MKKPHQGNFKRKRESVDLQEGHRFQCRSESRLKPREMEVKKSWSRMKMLVLFDMNGTLLVRSKKRGVFGIRDPDLVVDRTYYFVRPGAKELIEQLLTYHDVIDIGFYTSMKMRNALPAAKFFDKAPNKDTFRPDWNVFDQSYNIFDKEGDRAWGGWRRELTRVWSAGIGRGHDITTTLTVDDTYTKMRQCLDNVIVVPEYEFVDEIETNSRSRTSNKWQMAVDSASGREYYWNTDTRLTQWESPHADAGRVLEPTYAIEPRHASDLFISGADMDGGKKRKNCRSMTSPIADEADVDVDVDVGARVDINIFEELSPLFTELVKLWRSESGGGGSRSFPGRGCGSADVRCLLRRLRGPVPQSVRLGRGMKWETSQSTTDPRGQLQKRSSFVSTNEVRKMEKDGTGNIRRWHESSSSHARLHEEGDPAVRTGSVVRAKGGTAWDCRELAEDARKATKKLRKKLKKSHGNFRGGGIGCQSK
jgi:hypothetical protein